MENFKRYSYINDGTGLLDCTELPNGEFVKFSDVKELLSKSDNNRSDEIAFLEKLEDCYFKHLCIDYSNIGYKLLMERIAQLRAVR